MNRVKIENRRGNKWNHSNIIEIITIIARTGAAAASTDKYNKNGVETTSYKP